MTQSHCQFFFVLKIMRVYARVWPLPRCRSQRPRNEAPPPRNSQRGKGGFDWSAHWARLGVPSPEEIAARMRFYRLYGADGNRMALPASWDSFGNGILMMLKGSSEYKLLENLTVPYYPDTGRFEEIVDEASPPASGVSDNSHSNTEGEYARLVHHQPPPSGGGGVR